MAYSGSTCVADGIRTLWSAGAIGGENDRALLARFSQGRDEVAEAAFRVLVERHGPMVVRVCRSVMGNGGAAEDAAQAVFLVLARKAGSIRVGGTLGPWLYGVARRVAARARARNAARHAREERTVRAVAAERTAVATDSVAHHEEWAAVHDEVGRLPERYRTPVVLCYLEGQTYTEAARQIGCPVGTVRARLSRARDRLRDRLSRRGFHPECNAGIAALVASQDLPALPEAAVAAAWVDATVRSAMLYVGGRALASGVVPELAAALGDEVVRSLAMSPWKVGFFVVATLGASGAAALGVGGLAYRNEALPTVHQPAPAIAEQLPPPKKPQPETIVPLPDRPEVILPKQMERRFEAARQRLDAQRAYYEEGRITVDRFLDAIEKLYVAETEKAKTHEERILAAQRYTDRVAEVTRREQAELKVGRGTVADVAEALLAHERASMALVKAHMPPGPADAEVLMRRIKTLEEKLEKVTEQLERERSAAQAKRSGADRDAPPQKRK
jgi:RNA polymerase sigma factor (sigma-70 family)